MKVTFTALIAEASGSVGPAVFSRWKGRPYVRTKVTPANPNTALQQTQRNHMARVNAWWAGAKAYLKQYLTPLAQARSLSEFNMFVERNLKDLADEVDERIMPLATSENPIGQITGADTGSSGQIDLTWDQGQATTGHEILVYVQPTGLDPDQGALAKANLDSTTYAEDCGCTITGLTPGQEYDIWIMVDDTAEHNCSIALKDTASAGS